MITAYQLSPVITTKVTSYLKYNNIIIKSRTFSIAVNDFYNFYLTASFNNVKLSNAGNYTCFYQLSNNSFVETTGIKTAVSNVTVSSEFSFHT